MRKVVCNEELRNSIEHAINLLCDTVKMTLGPGGSNAIIDHSLFNPYITNDGVTIAENIESDDVVVNTILELAKEATIKTNENVGDGTTTTLVLLQKIYNEGIKLINQGISPMILKKEFDKVTNIIVNKLKEYSRKPTKEELLNISNISSNDNEIGSLIYNTYIKIKDKNSIIIKEGEYDTYVRFLKGYSFDADIVSPYFLKSNEIVYDNSFILLSDSSIYSLEEISSILNYINGNNKSLIIIASDYEESFVNEILSLVINENYKIMLLKNPQYGFKQLNLLRDIASISSATINHDYYDIKSLGCVSQAIINKEKIKIGFELNKEIKKRVTQLEKELSREMDEYEKEYYYMNIAMLKNKTAEIFVGAPTKAERREKKMRFDDALCSISSAYNGIVIGSGLSLYKVSEELNNDIYSNVYKNALKTPLKQILINSGSSEKLDSIISSNYKKVYNVVTSKYEDIENTKIVDPLEVVINSLVNATSVAGMLLTTNSLIINENNDKADNNIV